MSSSRREFLESAGHACAATLVVTAGASTLEAQTAPSPASERQRFLLVGLVGSENPTRANFPFVWAAALHEAGHDVRIELAGDATVLMRSVVASNVTPVGWPPFSESLARVIEHKIPIFV
jgi:hypothetical protein